MSEPYEIIMPGFPVSPAHTQAIVGQPNMLGFEVSDNGAKIAGSIAVGVAAAAAVLARMEHVRDRHQSNLAGYRDASEHRVFMMVDAVASQKSDGRAIVGREVSPDSRSTAYLSSVVAVDEQLASARSPRLFTPFKNARTLLEAERLNESVRYRKENGVRTHIKRLNPEGKVINDDVVPLNSLTNERTKLESEGIGTLSDVNEAIEGIRKLTVDICMEHGDEAISTEQYSVLQKEIAARLASVGSVEEIGLKARNLELAKVLQFADAAIIYLGIFQKAGYDKHGWDKELYAKDITNIAYGYPTSGASDTVTLLATRFAEVSNHPLDSEDEKYIAANVRTGYSAAHDKLASLLIELDLGTAIMPAENDSSANAILDAILILENQLVNKLWLPDIAADILNIKDRISEGMGFIQNSLARATEKETLIDDCRSKINELEASDEEKAKLQDLLSQDMMKKLRERLVSTSGFNYLRYDRELLAVLSEFRRAKQQIDKQRSTRMRADLEAKFA
jgi:hypothetical protein